MVVSTTLSNPGTHRDVQDSLALKVAGGIQENVVHGATLHHVAAPFHALFLGFCVTDGYIDAGDAKVSVFEEGFL